MRSWSCPSSGVPVGLGCAASLAVFPWPSSPSIASSTCTPDAPRACRRPRCEHCSRWHRGPRSSRSPGACRTCRRCRSTRSSTWFAVRSTSTARRRCSTRSGQGHASLRARLVELMAAEERRGRSRGRGRHDRCPTGPRPARHDLHRRWRPDRRRGTGLRRGAHRPSAHTSPGSCRSTSTTTA